MTLASFPMKSWWSARTSSFFILRELMKSSCGDINARYSMYVRAIWVTIETLMMSVRR